MTKKEKQMIENYNNSNYTDIMQVYKTCSYDKRKTFLEIRGEMVANDGSDLRVCTHNRNYYTCAYKTADGKTLIYHTPTNKYRIKIK